MADYRQDSNAPTRKVMAGTLAGALSAVVVWAVNTFHLLPGGTQVPGEIASSLTTILGFIVAYMVPPSAADNVVSATQAVPAVPAH